jgi:hypothetical protein
MDGSEVDNEVVEDADLVTVLPAPNTLSLVLREEGVNRFVKLISHDAPGNSVYSCNGLIGSGRSKGRRGSRLSA